MQSVIWSSITRTSLALLLIAVASLPVLADSPAQPSTLTASVGGTVVDRDGSLPIAGATIDLEQGNDDCGRRRSRTSSVISSFRQ